MPAEGRENPLLKKGNSDAFFREKYLTKNRKDRPDRDGGPLPCQRGCDQRYLRSDHQSRRCVEPDPAAGGTDQRGRGIGRTTDGGRPDRRGKEDRGSF